MNVANLYYGTIAGGPYSGALAVHLELTRRLPNTPTSSILSAPEVVALIVNHPQGKWKGLVIYGDLHNCDDSEMFEFVSAMRDWNYYIAVLCDGTMKPNWFEKCSWTVVILAEKPWLMFRCNEIRLQFSEEGTPEPQLPPNSNPILYICPSTEIPMVKVFDFIKSAEHNWHIFAPGRAAKEKINTEEATK